MNACVVGANGRMGQEIAAILSHSKKLKPSLGIVRKDKAIGYQNSATFKTADLKKIAVVMDFSSAETFDAALDLAVKNKKAFVSGVTGLSEKQFAALKKAAEKIPVLWSSNTSLGVALLRKAMQALAAAEGFDFQIEEFHHNQKKDKPSGTAKTLQKDLDRITQQKNPEPLAIRGGGVFGIHKVYAMSKDETLCFEHMALNRSLFAAGAVRAAEWILDQDKGLYEMTDVLSL